MMSYLHQKRVSDTLVVFTSLTLGGSRVCHEKVSELLVQSRMLGRA
jgi:hypothetical protein